LTIFDLLWDCIVFQPTAEIIRYDRSDRLA
jgi:hypothetical protein